MAELKLMKPAVRAAGPACCGPRSGASRPDWVTGALATEAGEIPVISTDLSRSDLWEHLKCRVSAFRDKYSVEPGLYAVGTPGRDSDVFASANYKFSFDELRKALKGLNAWVLVLDTRGINVWCAAGKGTFGTEELVRRISAARLGRVVDHRRIIVPQLGGPGISAHLVKKATGFSVSYGPVRAEDISAYIGAGYTATKEMRRVKFPLVDRLVLTPMEINPAMKKYYPWYALAMLAVFGLQPEGILFRDAVTGALPFLLLGLATVLSGALVTPLLLPFVPFRSFAVKGWIMGMASTFCLVRFTGLPWRPDPLLHAFTYLFFPLASSYIALQFTGSTTFTGMSGVRKELKVSIPLYLAGVAGSLVLLVLHKLGEWRIL